MNIDTFEKLQLNEVKELVKVYCVSQLGKKLIDNLKPSKNINIVQRRLNENREAKIIIENSSYIPLEGLFDITSIIDKAQKGMILEAKELIVIEDFLRGCRKIKTFMECKEFYAPTLSSYALNISSFENIEEEIKYCIKNNKVDSNASKELKKIRRNIEVAEEKIKDRLNKFLISSSNKKYIQENIITKRDERYVIPIKASYKNEVDGLVLDTSSKGTTVFVEPSSISKFSLDLISLKSEEIQEEYKILSYLTELIYDKIQNIKLNTEIIGEYDMVFAKAKHSINTKSITPEINNHGYINIVNGKHPLLKGDVVPLNIQIGRNYRSLVITGPNAGGKTIALKTVGILTLMCQCGLDINCSENTEISVFENIFVDIGDNQSIENALSTFSSHIKNIANIINSSNNKTLVIFDEICSGTEPNEGAGLAIAILEELYQSGSITLASTHYGEIKKFALNHPDFENAGMMFDKESLEPIYKLVIGKSEDSNALFISRKMGIKDKVLKKSIGYINDKNYNFKIIDRNKLVKDNSINEIINNSQQNHEYEKGDKVKLLDENDYAIIYDTVDKYNNIKVLYKEAIREVNYKRIESHLKAKDLYPIGYNLDTLFVDYKELKLEKDIKRGSKKTLKKIQKEIRNK